MILVSECYLMIASVVFSLGVHSYDFLFFLSVILTVDKIARIGEVLEFLKFSIHSSYHDTVRINKVSLVDIRTFLQNAQEKIEFVEFESKL